jgi:hypothetical protein
MFTSGSNWETFDKDGDWVEILKESGGPIWY